MDTLQDYKAVAHLKAFNTVLDLIVEKVIEHNEVVQLSALGIQARAGRKQFS